MKSWLVYIGFGSPQPLSTIVKLQALLGDEQLGLSSGDFTIVAIVRASEAPDLSAMPFPSTDVPDILVVEIGGASKVAGRPEFVANWALVGYPGPANLP